MATANQLDDITECPICTEVYTDPRVLRCGHTFCLKCLETYSKDKRPKDKVSCPMCRKGFTLSRNGVGALPRNIAVVKLLQTKELSSAKSNTKCNRHADQNVDLCCVDCSITLCTLCFVADHHGHTCTDVYSFANKCQQQVTNVSEKIAAGVDKCRELLTRIEKEKENVVEELGKIEAEVCKKAEQLKQMIDDHKEKLMDELSSMKQKRLRKIESLREEIETRLVSMESYKKFVDKVRHNETACGIARVASGLHDRADELLTFRVTERRLADLGRAYVKFTTSNYVMDDINKTLGQLTVCQPYAIALYDYQAVEDNEISFDPNDVITDLEFTEEGWWRGTCRGVCGLFPANFVQLRNA